MNKLGIITGTLAAITLLAISSFSEGPIGVTTPTPILTAQLYLPLVLSALTPTTTATATPTVTLTPTVSPTATATSTPGQAGIIDPPTWWNPANVVTVSGARWLVTKIHMLDPCENHMMEIAFVETEDENGNPLSGVNIRYIAGSVDLTFPTGDKGPGKAEFPMTVPMNLSVRVDSDSRGPAISNVAAGLENYNTAWNLPDYYTVCAATGLQGNAPKHLSYSIVFRRLY